MRKMSYVVIILCFLPCSIFAQENSNGAASEVSDSTQAMLAPDYKAASSYESTGGVKTLEEVKSELAGGGSQQESPETDKPEEKGVKGFWNKITGKNKNTAQGVKSKTGVKVKSGVSAKTKGKVNPKAKPNVTPTKNAAKKSVVAGKTKSSSSKIKGTKSIHEQMEESGGGSVAVKAHHF